MDGELVSALVADKAISLALLVAGIAVIWRRYVAATDKLVAALTSRLDAVVSKLTDVENATRTGLAGVHVKIDEHGRRLDIAEKKLDRHAELIGAMSAASGVYAIPRPRLVGAEEDGGTTR